MTETAPVSSARREELLDRAYRYVTRHGLSAMSLRPLATEIGSSPRVLLFLFGSKDGLVRALLARARADEMAHVQRVRVEDGMDLPRVGLETWPVAYRRRAPRPADTVDRELRPVTDRADGPWANFAAGTVDDWLTLLAETQPAAERHTAAGEARRTLALAILRGALLDLLATGDVVRTTRAVTEALEAI